MFLPRDAEIQSLSFFGDGNFWPLFSSNPQSLTVEGGPLCPPLCSEKNLNPYQSPTREVVTHHSLNSHGVGFEKERGKL